MKATKHKHLPGDVPDALYKERMLRVNHAGELAAKRIYQGQLAILGKSAVGDIIRHMAEQEEEHLAYFEKELVARRIRPTALYPLWEAMGFVLGAGSALLGQKAAMACTVAVEEVIDAHYEEQMQTLGRDEADLKRAIKKFQDDEMEHRDIGLAHDAERAPHYALLHRVIAGGCKLAIQVAKRV